MSVHATSFTETLSKPGLRRESGLLDLYNPIKGASPSLLSELCNVCQASERLVCSVGPPQLLGHLSPVPANIRVFGGAT